jgi:hypothetical protein
MSNNMNYVEGDVVRNKNILPTEAMCDMDDKPDGTCSRCRFADFDDDTQPLCWRLGLADKMPPTRCQYYDMDEAFK